MDIRKVAASIPGLIKKYRYVLLILALGIALMCLPSGTRQATESNVPTTRVEDPEDLAERMEALLCAIDGAGKVKVLLTESEGEKYIYQYDSDSVTNDTGSSVRIDTVIITDSERNQQALLTQIIPPCYCGAVILCQGGDQPAVRLAVVEAVSKLTGLGADKICVLKMK